MIDGIRRRLKSVDRDPWDAEQELEPEAEEASELPTDTAVLLAATQVTAGFAPNDTNTADYYKNVVRTAIENGGKYGDHRISIPWLRMILAGLEWKRVEPEAMWYGVEASTPSGSSLPEVPPFDDLFPSERDVPTGPGPR